MAQTFNILDWRKNIEFNRYYAKIEFENCVYDYEIITNANIEYNGWINNGSLNLSILDGFDMPFDKELPYLKITGMSYMAGKREKALERAFMDFIKTECGGEFKKEI